MPAVLVATRNEHKLRELRELLPGVELDPLPPEIDLPPEEWESFAENALGKARAAHVATGRPAIADDSGIEAHGLDGRPGIRSARYAGEDATDEENLAKLLEEVRCEGTLAREPRGTGGFGYDPAFVPDDTGPGDQRTMAELSLEEKNAISHRGRAVRALATHLGLGAGG